MILRPWLIGADRVLSSFKTTENFDTPTMADVHDYRGYLATHPLVAEPETRFLDFSEDLICTGATSEVGIFAEETATTPMPRRMSIPSNPTLHEGVADYGYFNRQVPDDIPAESTIPIKLIMVIAIVLPTLTFGVIPGYRGRMAVVVLVGLGMLGALLQIRKVGLRTTNDFCICAGAYGAIMAVIAGVCR